MTKNVRPRHAAHSRTSKIAGRAALGLLGAPVAMFAAAGPASAAGLDLVGSVTDDAVDAQVATDDGALPGVSALGISGLSTGALSTDDLPIDGAAFEGVPLDLLGAGEALPLPALPGADALPLPALPGDDALPLPALPALPALPGADALPLPALPGDLPVEVGTTDDGGLYANVHLDLPGAPAVDDADSDDADSDDADSDEADSDEADDADSDEADSDEADDADSDDVAVPAAADIFSATDLVSGLL
jgi:hypothetical protein